MNYIRQFSKYNWNPKVIIGVFSLNTCLYHYKYNKQGTIKYIPLGEYCSQNKHIFAKYKFHVKDNDIKILEPLILTGVFGLMSLPIVSHEIYENYLDNEKYSVDNKCVCGKTE